MWNAPDHETTLCIHHSLPKNTMHTIQKHRKCIQSRNTERENHPFGPIEPLSCPNQSNLPVHMVPVVPEDAKIPRELRQASLDKHCCTSVTQLPSRAAADVGSLQTTGKVRWLTCWPCKGNHWTHWKATSSGKLLRYGTSFGCSYTSRTDPHRGKSNSWMDSELWVHLIPCNSQHYDG